MYKNLHTCTKSVFTFYLNPIPGEQNEMVMMSEPRTTSLCSFLFPHSDSGVLLCLMVSCNLTVPHSIFKLLCPRCFSLMTLSTQNSDSNLLRRKVFRIYWTGHLRKKKLSWENYGYITVASVHVFRESQINIFLLVE